jgi:hypothetical protein
MNARMKIATQIRRATTETPMTGSNARSLAPASPHLLVAEHYRAN